MSWRYSLKDPSKFACEDLAMSHETVIITIFIKLYDVMFALIWFLTQLSLMFYNTCMWKKQIGSEGSGFKGKYVPIWMLKTFR